jgi:hypothetical protein
MPPIKRKTSLIKRKTTPPKRHTSKNPNIKNHKKYEQVLKSIRWKELRRIRYKRQQGRCSGCQRYFHLTELHLHHLHYKSLGKERLKDVTLVCKFCHWIEDRRRIIKKSIHTFCDLYFLHHGSECPPDVLNHFIEKQLLPSLPSAESRGITTSTPISPTSHNHNHNHNDTTIPPMIVVQFDDPSQRDNDTTNQMIQQ